MCVNGTEEVEFSCEQNNINKLLQNMPKLADTFDIHSLSGEGTFSSVYLGTLKQKYGNTKEKFAIKHIVPTCHPKRIMFELNCLKLLGGNNNVAKLDLCLREKNNVVFVMPFHPHQPFNEYVHDMDCKEIANYMFNLLKAIAHVHKHGIIHRDIKPSNFLYDRHHNRFLLVDFGLAQLVEENSGNRKRKRESEESDMPDAKRVFVNNNLKDLFDSRLHLAKKQHSKENIPQKTGGGVDLQNGTKEKTNRTLHKSQKSCTCYGKPQTCNVCITQKNIYASRAGTPGFRPPEVLLKSKNQTQAIDIWGAGVIFITILSRCNSFFSSPDDMTALSEIITLFGSEAIEKVASFYGYKFLCSEYKCGMNLENLCCALRSRKISQNMTELLCEKCHLPSFTCVNNASFSFSSLEMNERDIFPQSAYDLLKTLLDVNAKSRITADDALKHPFFGECLE